MARDPLPDLLRSSDRFFTSKELQRHKQTANEFPHDRYAFAALFLSPLYVHRKNLQALQFVVRVDRPSIADFSEDLLSNDEGLTDDDTFGLLETVVERENGGTDGTMTASASIEGAQVEGVDKDDEEAKEGSAFALDEVAVRHADAAILADDEDRQRRRSHSRRDIESRVMDYPTSLHYLRRLQQSSMIRDGHQTANARAFCSPTSIVGHNTSTSTRSASSLRTTPRTSSTSA
ncbi:hypothetical protein FI667_g5475, partial [Globisporangium splendens]